MLAILLFPFSLTLAKDTSCFNQWVYGYSDYDPRGSFKTIKKIKSAEECQTKCADTSGCVNFMWDKKTHECSMKNSLMVDKAIDIIMEEGVTVPQTPFCNFGMPYQCLHGGFECLKCSPQGHSCVFKSYYKITGPPVCPSNYDPCAHTGSTTTSTTSTNTGTTTSTGSTTTSTTGTTTTTGSTTTSTTSTTTSTGSTTTSTTKSPTSLCAYKDVSANGSSIEMESLVSLSRQSGAQCFTVGSIVASAPGTCEAAWHGKSSWTVKSQWGKDSIGAFLKTGGDLRVSFGGYGPDLALACGDVDSLYDQYKSVVEEYGVRNFDMWVEGQIVGVSEGLWNMTKALVRLQKMENIHVGFTLIATKIHGSDILSFAPLFGLDVDYVNVIPNLSIYNATTVDVPKTVEDAFEMTKNAIQNSWKDWGVVNLTDAEAYAMTQVSPTIGVNTSDGKIVLTPSDISTIAKYSKAKGAKALGMDSIDRDHPCVEEATEACSGLVDGKPVQSTSFEFAKTAVAALS